MRQAVEDGTVVPLLYEGRMVDLEPDRAALVRWFERHTRRLSDEQKSDLKRKMSRAEIINDVTSTFRSSPTTCRNTSERT